MEYEAVIGLEVHLQVRTASKIFCSCANRFGEEPNTLVCPVCLGYPGVLPAVNKQAITKTIAAGMMCNCEIAGYSKFDRKNYFYPDMPKNYQISQYDLPLCQNGSVRIEGVGFSGDEIPRRHIGVRRIHLEEDVAKSIHVGSYSVIDFNRAGVPLMEIVSEPDMTSPDEAHAYLTELKQMMHYADISDCDMEKGQMRCDVNVSVRAVDNPGFGTKVEIKNLNSFRAVHRALSYEIERQKELLEESAAVEQETRRWNDEEGVTTLMRTKEEAHDYRYFPEPDLMPLQISADMREEIRRNLPESPASRRERFVQEYAITAYDAQVLTGEKALADFFEEAAAASSAPKRVANVIMTEFLGWLGDQGKTVRESPVGPEAIRELVSLVENETISMKIAKDVFSEMMETGKAPGDIVEEKGLQQVTDQSVIESYLQQVVQENPSVVDDYKSGKEKALKYLVGQVMKLSQGKANPQQVNDRLRDMLSQ